VAAQRAADRAPQFWAQSVLQQQAAGHGVVGGGRAVRPGCCGCRPNAAPRPARVFQRRGDGQLIGAGAGGQSRRLQAGHPQVEHGGALAFGDHRRRLDQTSRRTGLIDERQRHDGAGPGFGGGASATGRSTRTLPPGRSCQPAGSPARVALPSTPAVATTCTVSSAHGLAGHDRALHVGGGAHQRGGQRAADRLRRRRRRGQRPAPGPIPRAWRATWPTPSQLWWLAMWVKSSRNPPLTRQVLSTRCGRLNAATRKRPRRRRV
jgi:hypothetical protein